MLYQIICCFFFFFFKQKTAYEMRISDWSSDVCSSDLMIHHCRIGAGDAEGAAIDHIIGGTDRRVGIRQYGDRRVRAGRWRIGADQARGSPLIDDSSDVGFGRMRRDAVRVGEQRCDLVGREPVVPRSEEHTSELQSLMRT